MEKRFNLELSDEVKHDIDKMVEDLKLLNEVAHIFECVFTDGTEICNSYGSIMLETLINELNGLKKINTAIIE